MLWLAWHLPRGKVYEFIEHVILDYELDPYVWLLFVVARGVSLWFGWLAANWVFSAR